MNTSFFQELLTTIGERGRSLLVGSAGQATGGSIRKLCQALLSSRGEASGVAIASQILAAYETLDAAGKDDYFHFLLEDLAPDADQVGSAARSYLDDPSADSMKKLSEAVESPRQIFFRRLNLAPGATARIVSMREDLIDRLPEAPDLDAVDADLLHLLASWFNRGFLVMKTIDWDTPASILEKIIEYEAVHEIRGWDDLRRRLDPRDRRCFGFFHPSLVDEPLIFVEVALTREIPGSIQELLAADPETAGEPTTAVFYSISNCQAGLRGISFGNFLIKQVAEDLAKAIPSLKTFVTLSPAPRFAAWLVRLLADHKRAKTGALTKAEMKLLDSLEDPSWAAHAETQEQMRSLLLSLASAYYLEAKTRHGRPVDPVARFHLGNGAVLERINWLGDKSAKGLRQSHGIMVNYLYDLKSIEKNHEAYINEGYVAASKGVHQMLRSGNKSVVKTAQKEPVAVAANE